MSLMAIATVVIFLLPPFKGLGVIDGVFPAVCGGVLGYLKGVDHRKLMERCRAAHGIDDDLLRLHREHKRSLKSLLLLWGAFLIPILVVCSLRALVECKPIWCGQSPLFFLVGIAAFGIAEDICFVRWYRMTRSLRDQNGNQTANG